MREIAAFLVLLSLCCAIPQPPYNDQRDLELVLVLTRHGARSSTHPLSDLVEPNPWPTGPRTDGELTPEGKQMHYELGGYFRAWLVDGEGFLDATHLNFSHVAVRSSGMDRTVESAGAFLKGLYPEPDATFAVCDGAAGECFQPMAIQTVGQHMDPMLRPWDCCDAIQDYWASVVYGDEQQDQQASEQAFFDGVAAKLGMQSLNFSNLEYAYDPLHADTASMPALPAGLDAADVDRVTDNYYDLKRWHFDSDADVTRLLSSEMLREFAAQIQAHLDGEAGPRLRLYSGHDYTIMGVLSALGRFDGTIPPYASHLEVHVRAGADGPIAAVSLNNESVLVEGGACEQSLAAGADGLQWCAAADLVSDFMLLTLKDESEWDAACGNAVPVAIQAHREYVELSERTALNTTEIVLIVLTGVFFVAALVLALVFFVPRSR